MVFPTVLRPGESRDVVIFFNAMPDGQFQFYPRGVRWCCGGEITLETSALRITAARLLDVPDGRELVAVGEVSNASSVDIAGLQVAAHPAGFPDLRVQTDGGCSGVVTHNDRAPIMLELLLGRQPSDGEIVVEGIQGYQSMDLYPVPVGSVATSKAGEDWRGLQRLRVSATVTNGTSEWLWVVGTCFNLRDKTGRLVGTSSLWEDFYLSPGESRRVSAEVYALDSFATSEVKAYAKPSLPPPEPVPIPAP